MNPTFRAYEAAALAAYADYSRACGLANRDEAAIEKARAKYNAAAAAASAARAA